MATTVKLNPSGAATYGHNKTTSTTSTGTGTLYMGSCYGGSNYLHYGSSIPFKLANPTADGSPVVITSAVLTSSRKNDTPFNTSSTKNNNCVYVNQTAAPSPNYSGVTDRSNAPAFTDSTNLSKYLDILSTYVSNSSTFYVHIMDASLSLTGKVNSAGQQGGTIYGSSEKAKPYLTLTWEYANSTGYLSTSTITAGTAFNLSLNIKGSNYYHKVSYKIGNDTVDVTDLPASWGAKNEAATVGTSSKSITISPTATQIYNWFGETSTSKTITFTVTTYKVGTEDKIGNSVNISATFSLSQNYCRNLKEYSPTIQISYARKGGSDTKDISNYTKYNISDTITIKSGSNFLISSHKLAASGNYSSSLTVSNTSATSLSFTPVLGTGAMTVTSTVTDKRGYVYYSTITINPTRTSYSLPVIDESSIVFRTNGESKKTDGTYLGVSIRASYSSATSTRSLSLAPKGGSAIISNLNGSSNPITLNSNKVGTATYDTEESYTFIITAYDNILSSSDYNHPYGTSVTKEITLSKAEFIIHISDAGTGLGFMTSGEKGHICLGKPAKGLKIVNPTFSLDFNDFTSKEKACDAIGAAYVDEDGLLTTWFVKATDGLMTNVISSTTDESYISYYPSVSLTAGNSKVSLILKGTDIFHYVNGTKYYPLYEYNAGDTVKYIIDGYDTTDVDNLVLSAANFYGYLTGSRTSLNITIPLAKPIHKSKIDGVKFTSFKALIRTDKYYTLQKAWDDCYDESTKLLKMNTTLSSSGYYNNNAIDYLPLLSNTFTGTTGVNNNFSRICFDNNGYATQIIVCFRSDGKIYGTESNAGHPFYGNTNAISMCSALDVQFTFTKGSTTGVYK